MAKAKLKTTSSIPNRHIYTRVSYLYQAASYLTNAADVKHTPVQLEDPSAKGDSASLKTSSTYLGSKTGTDLLTQIRGISRKARLRLQSDVKRAICKRCDALLIPGHTSTTFMENTSSGGQKPWADVLVLQCNQCQTAKRFPVGQARSRKNTQNGVKLNVDVDEKTLHKDVS